MLDAEEVVVRKTVSARVMLGLYRSLPVPHHQVEDGDRATERRQGGDEYQRRKTLDRGFPIHQHPMVNVTSHLPNRVSYVNIFPPPSAIPEPSSEQRPFPDHDRAANLARCLSFSGCGEHGF